MRLISSSWLSINSLISIACLALVSANDCSRFEIRWVKALDVVDKFFSSKYCCVRSSSFSPSYICLMSFMYVLTGGCGCCCC